MKEFRKIDPNLQMQTALAFIVIAQNDHDGTPLTVYEVGDHLNCTSASASRNVAALSAWSRHKKEGYGLVEANENPIKRNEKIITLTPKGKQWVDSLLTICGTKTVGVNKMPILKHIKLGRDGTPANKKAVHLKSVKRQPQTKPRGKR